MPKVTPEDLWEKLFAGAGHVSVIRELIKTNGEITQIELAKRTGVTPTGISRIIKSIRENDELKEAFLSEKKYNARVYRVNKNHLIIKKLKILFGE